MRFNLSTTAVICNDLLLVLGMAIGGDKKATPCLGILGLSPLTGLLARGWFQALEWQLELVSRLDPALVCPT